MKTYSIHGGKQGNKRLAILSRTLSVTTGDFLDRYHSSISGRCLDLGCGGGAVTLEIAKRIESMGEVYGMDLDPVNIALAREAAEDQKLDNVHFERFDAYELADEDCYQTVYSRFLLSHLHQPMQVLANIFRSLVPGGRLLLEDTDFSGHFCYPACHAFDTYVRLYQHLLHKRRADANIGQRLHQMVLRQGFEQISVRVIQPVHTVEEGKLMAEITMEGISEALLKEELASREEIDQTVMELKAFRADENTVMSLPRIFQVSAIKPLQSVY